LIGQPLPTSLFLSNVALPQHLYRRVVGENDHVAAPVASSPSGNTPLLPQQSEASPLVLEEEEWEIRSILGKRRAGTGYEYKVRWKDTWLPKSELGNAQRLLQEFEAKGRVQHGGKRIGLARTGRVR